MGHLRVIPGIPIALNGQDFIIPPLNLGSLEVMQERLQKYRGAFDAESIKTVLDAAHAALKRNYPDMTREFIGEHIDLANMHDIMAAIMDAGGLRRKEIEAGKAAAVQADSTGSASTAT